MSDGKVDQIGDWEVYVDEGYGIPYYFNAVTGETTWTAPAGAALVQYKHTPFEYEMDGRFRFPGADDLPSPPR